MFSWQKLALAAGLLVSVGCSVVPSDRYSNIEQKKNVAEIRNEVLQAKINSYNQWRASLDKFEARVSGLERISDPIAPSKDRNMELMNIHSDEEVGGGSQAEIFYLVQSSYSELDLQSANLANEITSYFEQDDFVRSYLLRELKDKVYDVTVEIAEITLRRSNHMASDRRLVTARLKSINECFLALRNLSQNEMYDLSFKQREVLLTKTDLLRMEYAKTLKTDYFPAIPHFVPIAQGEDYLKDLGIMNKYVTEASVFYSNANGPTGTSVFQDLKADLNGKKDALKSGSIK